jgi:mannose-6-phosphate isomerase-like protein (cupin superfamily)
MDDPPRAVDNEREPDEEVSMQSPTVSNKEMEARVVRFKGLTPRPKPSVPGVPAEVTEFMTADRNYSYMAPRMEGRSIIQQFAELVGGDAGDAISISIAECRPGNGPALHAHMNTVEAFFCLRGTFAITWGDEGEHSLTLEPWDFVHVPKGVVRTFTNVGDTDGALLVIIQGNRDEFDDVVSPPYVGRQLEEQFGADVVAKMQEGGRRFFAPTDAGS